MSDLEAWERHAAWWQEGFTEGADPEYAEQIVPLAAAGLLGSWRVLDLGCGEGQIARAAAHGGAAAVVGVDPTSAQLKKATERGGAPLYVRGRAEGLPFADGAFDAVVACLVFEHLADHCAPLAEVARVLAPGGRFLFFLNHPLFQAPGSGWIDDRILEEQYWRVGAYLEAEVTMEELAPGVVLQFVHRPLSQYVNTMICSGLHLEEMLEPAPPEGFLARAEEYREAATIPRLLFMRAVKRC